MADAARAHGKHAWRGSAPVEIAEGASVMTACAVSWCVALARHGSQFCAIHEKNKDFRTSDESWTGDECECPDCRGEGVGCQKCDDSGECDHCCGDGTTECPHCEQDMDCEACDGTGKCSACGGTGGNCGRCDGAGWVLRSSLQEIESQTPCEAIKRVEVKQTRRRYAVGVRA